MCAPRVRQTNRTHFKRSSRFAMRLCVRMDVCKQAARADFHAHSMRTSQPRVRCLRPCTFDAILERYAQRQQSSNTCRLETQIVNPNVSAFAVDMQLGFSTLPTQSRAHIQTLGVHRRHPVALSARGTRHSNLMIVGVSASTYIAPTIVRAHAAETCETIKHSK